MHFPRRAARSVVHDAEHGADRVGVPPWAYQTHPQAGPGMFVVIQLRLGTILGYREVDPPVPVVVGEGRPPLITVHGDPGDIPGDRHERAVALPEEQQPATGVVAWCPDLCGEEVLRQKQVLVPVAVEVRHAGIERRSELRLGG